MLIVGVGIYLTIGTGFVQLRLFPKAVASFFCQLRGGSSQYRSWCTALAATVGTGNMIGVAGAIVIGGPGAVFWMWICAFLGMAIKFAEATLAVRYRSTVNGEPMGGPMYMIRNGLSTKWHWLATAYCILGIAASFGVGNATQVNAFTMGVNGILGLFGIPGTGIGNLLIGLVLSVIVGFVLLGGGKRISDAAEKIVPIAAVAYILLCLIVLILRYEKILGAFYSIIAGAFAPKSVTGGLIGSAFIALRTGAARGTFTNEAGMGTAAIAHAGADVSHPADQGLMGIMEVFLDTILICTMTALVILCSGIPIPYGGADTGVQTAQAFSSALGTWSTVPFYLAICAFAIATVFGWSLYGGRCAQYLFGQRAWKNYGLMQAVVVVLGAIVSLETAWIVSEIMNALMAIPNLIAIMLLSPELFRLLRNYKTGA